MKIFLFLILLLLSAPALAVDFWKCQSYGPGTSTGDTINVVDYGNRFTVEEFRSPVFSEQKKYEHAVISAAFDNDFAYLKIRNAHGVHFEVHDILVTPGRALDTGSLLRETCINISEGNTSLFFLT